MCISLMFYFFPWSISCRSEVNGWRVQDGGGRGSKVMVVGVCVCVLFVSRLSAAVR